ncbi:MAG: radical SAM protein [Clostridia bacterium]|nr:radical SAM protein [Clostridia bacterium]
MIRKSLIYKTGVEYGDYTLNHVQGCSHGCKYPCYAFMMAKRFGKVKTYEEWIEPQIVENTMEILLKELPRYRDKIETLHLCFTTDPFMYGREDISELSMSVLRAANAYGVKCSVLTKGILPQSLAALPQRNEYGITMVSLNDEFRQQYEPGASSLTERLNALRFLSDQGCNTWVSIEPYPTPNIIEQNLDDLLNALAFTDKIIFGRLHYNKVVSEYREYQKFYDECAERVIEFCTTRNIAYHIKNGTMSEQEDK